MRKVIPFDEVTELKAWTNTGRRQSIVLSEGLDYDFGFNAIAPTTKFPFPLGEGFNVRGVSGGIGRREGEGALSAGGEGWRAGEAALSGGPVQSHDGAGQRLQVGGGPRVGQLAVLEVPRLQVDHARRHVSAEPGQHRAQLRVDAR